MHRAKILGAGGLLIMAVSFLLATSSRPIQFLDDAWITFRYARNLAFEGELTFNPAERVEGITNLLWALALSLEMRLMPAGVELLAAVSGLVLTALALQRIWALGNLMGLHPMTAALAPCLLILTPDFYATMTNGLEGPLFALLLAEALLRIAGGNAIAAAIALGLLFMTRPEAVAPGLFYLLLLLQPALRLEAGRRLTLDIFDLRSSRRRADFGRAFGIMAVIIGAVTAFRALYFGAIIPNSMQAKFYPFSWMLLDGGLNYLLEFGKSNPHLVLIVVISVGLVLSPAAAGEAAPAPKNGLRREDVQLAARIALFVILYSFIIPLRSGGDWMPASRLLIQYGSAYSAVLVVWLGRFGAASRSRQEPGQAVRHSSAPKTARRELRETAMLVVCLVLLVLPAQRTAKAAIIRWGEHAPLFDLRPTPGFPFWDVVAERLSAAPLNKSDVVSSEGIGYISYVLGETRMHDPLGLTDAHIARLGKERYPFGKLDLKYTLQDVRPSVMIWHYAGQLRRFDAETIDAAYVTYCHALCESWSADIAMIRRDRLADLGAAFDDWETITFAGLYALNP
jgi:hypothetical protein